MYPALSQRSQDYHPKGHRLPEIHEPKKREEKKGSQEGHGGPWDNISLRSLGPIGYTLAMASLPSLTVGFPRVEQWDFHSRKAREVSYSCLGGQSRHPNKMIQVPKESQARNSALSCTLLSPVPGCLTQIWGQTKRAAY